MHHAGLPENYKLTDIMDMFRENFERVLVENGGKIIVEDKTKGFSFEVKCELSERGKGMMLAGGLLNFTKNGR